MQDTNVEVVAGLRIIGAVAQADGKITEEERAVFRDAVVDFAPTLPAGLTVDQLLTEPSDLTGNLDQVKSPLVRRAIFEVAFAMSASDGATKEEGEVLKAIRTAFKVESEPTKFQDALQHNWIHLEAEPVLDDAERAGRVKALLGKRMVYAAVFGAIPIPFVSDVGVLVQIRAAIDEISTLWGQPLTTKEKWARFGSLFSIAFAQSAAHSLMKFIPGWGSVAGALSGGIASYVIVGAIGRAVDYHFKQDGNTTPEELRKVFKESKDDLKKEYAADKAKIDAARETHGAELEALARKLEAKEISQEEYEKKVSTLLHSAS
jgi:uncharacterized protein (DUF697 family)